MPKPTYQDLTDRISLLEAELASSRENELTLTNSLSELKKSLTSETKLKEELDKKNNLLFELTRIDGLTNLYNHQYIMSRCEHEFKRSLRYGTPLSCLMVDIDHFKTINDTFGHQFGDFILKEIAAYLREYSRTVDILGRYGGEEFIILVSRSEEKAYEYISRFHHFIESYAFKSGGIQARLTISVGIAEHKKDINSYQELIKRADQALYQAKEDGRNLIRIWSKQGKNEASLDNGSIEDFKSKFEDLSYEVKKTYIQSTNALLKAIDARDHYTLVHSHQVAEIAVQIARKIGLSDMLVNVIKNAGLLHDIGKIGIEKKILVKNRALTGDEYRLLKRHPVIGVNILKDISFLEQELPFILHHHERIDGLGYPHGLKGRSIPLGAKILAVADAYSSITTDREFKSRKTKEEAIVEIASQKSSQFDPEIVDVFVDLLEQGE